VHRAIEILRASAAAEIEPFTLLGSSFSVRVRVRFAVQWFPVRRFSLGAPSWRI